MYNNPYIYQNFVKPSLISRLLGKTSSLGLGKTINFGNILSNTQKSLGIINQAIPIVKEVKPLVNNAKSVFKIASLLNDNNSNKNNKITNSSNINSIKNNNKPIFYI